MNGAKERADGDMLSRTRRLLGDAGVERLQRSTVAVFGLGGVGAAAAEALARGGVGALRLVDADCVEESNLNRQLIALRSTLGRPKVDVMRERVLDINPACQVQTRQAFLLPENIEQFPLAGVDYIVDAIDTVSAKLVLAEYAAAHGVPIISAMGTGNKLDPTRFAVADIFSTSVCPLCRVMRRELRRRGIGALTVVYSTEPPADAQEAQVPAPGGPAGRTPPASVPFVPPVAGMILAGHVLRALAGEGENSQLI